MSQNVNTLDAAKFASTAFFSMTLRQYGNRCKVRDAVKLSAYLAELAKCDGNAAPPMVEGSTNTKRVSANKVLVKCEALDVVKEFLGQTKKQCLALCMPSCIREGMFVASLLSDPGKQSPVAQINDILRAAVQKLQDELLPELRLAWPDAVAAAQRSPIKRNAAGDGYELDPEGGLGPLYDASDYPRNEDGSLNTDKILAGFGIEWGWLALSVPEGLPPELRAEESDKLQKQFQDAATEVRDALRVMFAELVKHAADALKPGENGKKKIFRDTLTGNLKEFFDTFNSKNIMGDADLAALVTKCREIMGETQPDDLRKNDTLRATIAGQLEEIKAGLQPLVAELQTRSFDFSEQE